MSDEKILLDTKYSSSSDTKNEHKLKPVVKGETKPPGIFKRIRNAFISDDVKDVKNYLFFDILLPAIKDTVADMGKAAIEMVLYGDSGKSKKSKSYYASYNKYYERDSRSSRKSSQNEEDYSDEIMVKTKADVIKAFDELNEAIQVYGSASIADAYDVCDLEVPPWTNNGYGWVDPLKTDCSTIRYQGEWRYILNFPKPVYIKDYV